MLPAYRSFAQTRWLLRRCRISLATAVLTAFAVLGAVQADDTEVFFGQAGGGAESNPNILFILDTSGSMNNKDGTTTSRMDRMKEAMNLLLDQSSSFNVGLMGFSGYSGGGSVRYPIGYLEGESGNDCPEAGCPDEVVIARPSSGTDDAVENDTTGLVTLHAAHLAMGEIPANDTGTTIPVDAVVINGSSTATASVSEATRTSDAVVQHKSDEVSDNWFYFGTPDTHTRQRYAYRFDNISIPAGATITSAKITFVFDGTANQTGEVSAYITAESSSAPAAYPGTLLDTSTNPLLSERDLTSINTIWDDIPAGSGNQSIDTPELTDITQELIGLPGWASGNSISFMIESVDTSAAPAGAIRQFYGVAAPEPKVPVLSYSYIEAVDDASGLATFVAQAHAANYSNPNTLETTIDYNDTKYSMFYLDDEHEATQMAYRFDDINIPKNAVITSAFLRFWNRSSGGDVSARINAELTHEPADYSSLELAARTPTVAFVGWPAIPDTVDDYIDSVDIKNVITEVTSMDEWAENSSLSLMLSAGSDYVNDGSNLREFDSSTSAHPPKLVVSWTSEDESNGPDVHPLTTGIRFTNLHVPPGAAIQSAVLEFDSHLANDTETSLTIAAQKVGNSSGFTAADFDISSRPLTTNSTIWSVDPWNTVNTEYTSIDVTGVVQEVTDLTDWCGGNALTMIIDGTGLREAISFEQNPVASPRLRVTYSPDTVPSGAYCSNRSLVAAISASADDALQDNSGSGTVTIDSNQLETATTGNQVGLRFRGLQLDQGVEIINATLEVSSAADYAGGATLQIQAEQEDDSQVFSTASNNIGGRSWSTDSISWGPLSATSSEDSIYSSDLTSLISAVVARPGWVKGNALSLRLSGGSGVSHPILAYDGSEALSARLIIYYRGERTTPGTLFRENLQNEVDELVAQSGTPIVEALYEAGLYFTGGGVDYGRKRGLQQSQDRNHRVSHPYSYSGGNVYRPADCSSADLNASSCRNEEIQGDPVYESPINNRCQQSHIVLLSDGQPTSNNAAAKIRNQIGLASCAADNQGSSSEACGVELADWLYTNDHALAIPGEQKVTTHTIGFNLDTPGFLQSIAVAGGGDFYSADSASELLSAFKNIFINVSKSDTSFVAPSTSVNQFNRLKHRDDIYFAQFKPESTARWDGNLKKYKIQGNEGQAATIVDANGDAAINQDSGEFYQTSTSFWSGVSDAGDVTKGGAAAKFEGRSRNIYTYTGIASNLSLPVNALDSDNPNLKPEWLILPPKKLEDPEYQRNLLNWAAGYDAKDDDADGDVNETRMQMGDPLHSQPLLLNYAASGGSKSIIFIGTNEGYLHAIDHLTGYEEFAFVPQELLKNLQRFYDNDPARKRVYGIDGPITAWLSDDNNNGVIDPGEKALLYFGLRRGGNSYYAIDVSDIDNPTLAFRIEGGKQINDTDPLTADGDYRELAQSWSKPIKTRVMDDSGPRDVLIFSAGYNPNQDPAELISISAQDDTDANARRLEISKRRVDGSGRGLFIADASTGKLLWQTTAGELDYQDMLYSMPSDVRVVDINSDNLADQLYVGDMGGQVWRFDINNQETTNDPIDKRVTGGVIADFATDEPLHSRRFFYPPDVAVVDVQGQQELSVSIGSGWRAHPLHTDVQDRFYSFRLPDVYGPPIDSFDRITYTSISDKPDQNDIKNVTDDLGLDPTTFDGWYINMETPGEKVLSSSVTLNNLVIFTTYVPASNIEICSAAVGSGRVYAVNVLNGDPLLELGGASSEAGSTQLIKGDRYKTLNHAGIPPSPTVIFPEVGDPTVLLGRETFDEADVGKLKKRTYWREHVDENS